MIQLPVHVWKRNQKLVGVRSLPGGKLPQQTGSEAPLQIVHLTQSNSEKKMEQKMSAAPLQLVEESEHLSKPHRFLTQPRPQSLPVPLLLLGLFPHLAALHTVMSHFEILSLFLLCELFWLFKVFKAAFDTTNWLLTGESSPKRWTTLPPFSTAVAFYFLSCLHMCRCLSLILSPHCRLIWLQKHLMILFVLKDLISSDDWWKLERLLFMNMNVMLSLGLQGPIWIKHFSECNDNTAKETPMNFKHKNCEDEFDLTVDFL